MSKKTYTFVYKKGLNRFKIKDKLTICCVGGEKMTKEKDELVFLDSPKQIPKTKGKTGRGWDSLFSQIPIGKVLVMKKEKFGSAPNIRAQVHNYNSLHGDVLEATQRTKNEESIIYVTRIKENLQ